MVACKTQNVEAYTTMSTAGIVLSSMVLSVCCWSAKGGSSSQGKPTMQAVNPLYQRNMGQRTGLSFENIKAINLAYCADKCASASLSQPCQHGGYQDPNNCNRCICPDGFAGQYCDALAQPTYGKFCRRYDSFSPYITFSSSVGLKIR